MVPVTFPFFAGDGPSYMVPSYPDMLLNTAIYGFKVYRAC